MMTLAVTKLAVRSAALALSTLAAGGAALGVAANAMPREKVKPKVVLAGQQVGVMVWADRGLRVSWPTVQTNLGGAVQQRLLVAQKAEAKELANITFPFPAESFVRWQREHPGFEAEPIANVAPRLHVDRLIYVELEDLTTRSSNAMALYRGRADAALKVFDATQTPAKLLYEEKIHVTFPKTSTDDGRPDGSDERMYVGTIGALADEIAKRFVEYESED